MDEEGDDRGNKSRQQENSGLVMGPVYQMWESGLEKLKILNYEKDYCKKLGKKPLSRVQFVIPGANPILQFDEFISITSWLIAEISKKSDLFKPEQFDDPNIIINKLMYAVSKIDADFRLPTPNQNLKKAHGEAVCILLDFLTDKALLKRGFQWATPVYTNNQEVEQAEPVDENEDVEIEDEVNGNAIIEDDQMFEENARVEVLESNTHTILQQYQDPIEWKTELERVAPRLRASQQAATNEWRSHVDQTVHSKSQIEKVLDDTQGSLQVMNRSVTDELSRMKQKEKYLNNQYTTFSTEYIEIRHKLEELEQKSSKSHETVAKLTTELAEISEKLDDLKESIDSKDSGFNDASPLVKIKAALQQVKSEIQEFEMRIGVVSHSLLTAKVHDTNRSRSAAVQKARQRHNKNKRLDNDDNSILSGDD